MAQQLIVNNQRYQPSAQLAQEFGYSLNYVSRLAREGKIDATQVGRQWFVNPESLQLFFSEAEKKKEVLRNELRIHRKHEQSVQQVLTTEAHKARTVASEAETQFPSAQLSVGKKYFDIAKAFTMAAAVCVSGLLVGVAIQPEAFLSVFTNPYSTFFVAQWNSGASQLSTNSDTNMDRSAVYEPAGVSQGVVIFDADVTEEHIETVRRSFSDEVQVEFTGSDTGEVTPIFKDKNGPSYQFLLVPVETSS